MGNVSNVTMTHAEMKQRVYYLIGESSGTLFPAAQVTNFLNQSFSRLHNVLNENYDTIYTTTSSGTQDYEIPEPMMFQGNAIVDSVWINDSQIGATGYQEWIDASGNTSDSDELDEPTSFFVNGNTISLYPRPDSIYELKIRYRREYPSPKLSGETDEVNLSDIYVDAAIFYAAYMLKAKDEQWESASFFKSEYDRVVADISMIKPGVYADDSGVYGGAD